MVRLQKRQDVYLLSITPPLLERLEQSGRERALAYKVLCSTGLRKEELRSLTVDQLFLDLECPHIILNPADEKNKAGSTIAISDSLAEDLRVHMKARTNIIQFSPGSRNDKSNNSRKLFDVPKSLSRYFNEDIAVAGIDKRDALGRVIDVHALRHTYCSNLAAAGVPLITAQKAMRHSDPKLTANIYTDPALLDLQGAANKLPDLSLDSELAEIKGIAEGTNDGPLLT